MAIQFPNFLQAQLYKPDYSGLGDSVDNFYAGKNMRNDDIIKRIAAEFARPNAEQTLANQRQLLANEKLTGQKAGLDLEKMRREMAQDAEFQAAFKKALQQGGNGAPLSAPQGMPQAVPAQQPASLPQAQMPAITPINPNLGAALAPTGISPVNQNMQGFDPAQMDKRFVKIDQQATGLPDNAYRRSSFTPSAPNMPSKVPDPVSINGVTPDQTSGIHEPTMPKAADEQIINEGSKNLYGIDALYDQNPLARDYLEKKGFKKKVETKFDSKSGKTRILTTMPSGRTILKTIGGGGDNGEGIPLTSKMVSKHQNIISSVDTSIPIIEKILEEGKGFQPYPRSSGVIPGMGYVPGFSSRSTTYEAQVKSALDTLIGAYGLPMTSEGLATVRDQLLIGHGETVSNYKRRLKSLVADLKKRKAYSENEVKRSNKIAPIDSSSGNNATGSDDTYSSDDWEAV